MTEENLTLTFKKIPTEFPDVFEIFYKAEGLMFSNYYYLGMLVDSKIVGTRDMSETLIQKQFLQFSVGESFSELKKKVEKCISNIIAFHTMTMTQKQWENCLSKPVVEIIESNAANYRFKLKRITEIEAHAGPLEILVSENLSLNDISLILSRDCSSYVNEIEFAAFLTSYDTTKHYQNTWVKIMSNFEMMKACKQKMAFVEYIQQDLQNPNSPISKLTSIYTAVKDYAKTSIKIKGIQKPFKLKGSLKYVLELDGIRTLHIPDYGAGGKALSELYRTKNNSRNGYIPYDDIESISFNNQVVWQHP